MMGEAHRKIIKIYSSLPHFKQSAALSKNHPLLCSYAIHIFRHKNSYSAIYSCKRTRANAII